MQNRLLASALLFFILCLPAQAQGVREPSSEMIRKWAQLAPLQAVGSTQFPKRTHATAGLTSYVTENFQIWYTLQGAHAITGVAANKEAGDSIPSYVRTAATSLEKAWKFYRDSLGMLAPLPVSTGVAFGQPSTLGRYQVEICNVSKAMTDASGIQYTGTYYGVVLPENSTSERTILLLAANLTTFLGWSYALDTGSTWTVNYANQWKPALAATAAHELFHSVQYRYEKSLSHFLFEASSVAMEKRVESTHREYMYFADDFFQSSQKSVKPLLVSKENEAYPHGLFVLTAMNSLGDSVVRQWWEARKENPSLPIRNTLRQTLYAQGWSLPELFGRHALRIGLSGKRSRWQTQLATAGRGITPPLAPWSDASIAPQALMIDSLVNQGWQQYTLGAGSMRFFKANAGLDSLVALWIPEGNAQLALVDSLSGAGLQIQYPTKSQFLPKSKRNAPLWVLTHSGSGVDGSIDDLSVYTGFVKAPTPLRVQKGLAVQWLSPEDLTLYGTATLTGTALPMTSVDIWKPNSLLDPWASQWNDSVSLHTVVLEDPAQQLSLTGATLQLPWLCAEVWQKTDATAWSKLPHDTTLGTSRVSLGDVLPHQQRKLLCTPATTAKKSRVGTPYPNPARENQIVTFPFQGPLTGLELSIFGADGHILYRKAFTSNSNAITWDLRNQNGSRVRPGLYWYAIQGATGNVRGQIMVAR